RFLITYKYNLNIGYLNRQYSYITRPFSFKEILYRLENMYTDDFIKKGNHIEIETEGYCIELHVQPKQIEFCCATMQDAETILFPILRQMYPYLFVISENPMNYGWISPILNKAQQKE